MVLEGDNAIQRLRDLMGATDPSKAAPGTIRRSSPRPSRRTRSTARTRSQSAAFEIPYFFPALDIHAR